MILFCLHFQCKTSVSTKNGWPINLNHGLFSSYPYFVLFPIFWSLPNVIFVSLMEKDGHSLLDASHNPILNNLDLLIILFFLCTSEKLFCVCCRFFFIEKLSFLQTSKERVGDNKISSLFLTRASTKLHLLLNQQLQSVLINLIK